MTERFVVVLDDPAFAYGDPAGWDPNMSEIWAEGYSQCRTDIIHNTVSWSPYDDDGIGFEIWTAGYEACHLDSLNGIETPNPYEED